MAQQSENSQYVIKNLEMIAEMQNKLECGLLSKNQPPHPIYYYTFPKTLMEGIYGNESNYQSKRLCVHLGHTSLIIKFMSHVIVSIHSLYDFH